MSVEQSTQLRGGAPIIPSGDLIGTSEAGRRLGVSADRVRQLTTAGRLPFIRTPLGKLYAADDVQRLADERAARGGVPRRHR